jgi:4-amino-4-deoxy-L-arabinose transferase-like glycosyltransferase
MGSSWHAFLVGGFNPNASVAIDKAPLDLWLQVATTKLFGFTRFALLLPEALASTAAVVLLYDVVRRGFGRTAGLGAAAALAVLPVDVITGRSDTMDGIMMALLVLAAWLVVRALEKGRSRELYAAAAVVGLAFETKLFEALVPLPALVLLFLVGSRAPWRRRLGQLALAGAVMVAVGIAWTVGFALTPSADRPYPMGSTNGSIWNTVFVYNGIGRLTSSSTRTATDALSPPGATRLLSAGPVHLNLLIGEVLFAALAFAVVACLFRLARGRQQGRERLPLALALAMGTWLVLGVAVLSSMRHMPVRYLEPLVPGIAAVAGIGVAYAARAAVGAGGRAIVPYIAASLAVLAALGSSLVYAHAAGNLPAAAVVGAAGAAILIGISGVLFRMRSAPRLLTPLAAVTAAFALLGVLAAPASESFALQRAHASDGGSLGATPTHTVSALSRYLTSHRGGRRYQFAAVEASVAAPLIVASDQPVLILAATPYRALVSPRGLSRAVRAGAVRYVLLSSVPANHLLHPFPPRTAREQIPAWVIRHGTDVTRQTGLRGYGILYRVTAAGTG